MSDDTSYQTIIDVFKFVYNTMDDGIYPVFKEDVSLEYIIRKYMPEKLGVFLNEWDEINSSNTSKKEVDEK